MLELVNTEISEISLASEQVGASDANNSANRILLND